VDNGQLPESALLDELWQRYLPKGSLRERLAKGVFWSFAGALISRVLALVASILVARMLGKEHFGELGIIQSTVGMFGAFAGFGLGLTATKYVAEFRVKDPSKAGRIIAFSSATAVVSGAIMAVVLAVLAPWLAAKTLAAPHLAGLLRISALLLFLGAVNGAQTGALAGFEAFKTIAKVSLAAGVLTFPCMVGGVYIAGLEGAVWGLAVSLAANWLLNHIALRVEARRANVPLHLSGCMQERSVLWTFSLPAVLAVAMIGPVTWLCNAILVNRPNGYSEMGIFNAANQWFAALMFLPSVLAQATMPMLSERLGDGDALRSKKILSYSIKLNALVILPIAIAGSVASPYIMSLYGEGFAGAWTTLVVVFLTAGVLAVQVPVGNIIIASGKLWTGFVMNSGWAVAFLIFTLILVSYGALGLAGARLIAYFFHATWTFGFAYLVLRQSRGVSHE